MNNKLKLISILFFFLSSCIHNNQKNDFITSSEISQAKEFPSGKLIIIQGPTSSTETNINVLSPRLKNYIYKVTSAKGENFPVEKYETVKNDIVHWKIDKLYIKNLTPQTVYNLEVVDEYKETQSRVDQRTFKTLNTNSDQVSFAYASCMSDDFRFNRVINPMWQKMKDQNPDMIVLNGDVVYVDSYDFVERKKATELDIWFRFIDSLNRLPIYKWTELKPIFATWDDHDFGTNDGDKDFISKQAARKIFLGFFGGKNLSGVYDLEPSSVYFSLKAFQQNFIFLDNRYFRQPNKDPKSQEVYAHWGEKQYKWLLNEIKKTNKPTWLFSGNQFFSGVALDYKESLQDNNPENFKLLTSDLKNINVPVVFGSGDVHFSEIMKIPADRIGYETYELTSSSMHSFTYSGWANPLRHEGAFTKEFNFMMIDSKALGQNKVKINVKSLGLSENPYFEKEMIITR